MNIRGWDPAWSAGTFVIEGEIQQGTKVSIIVDESSAASITKAMQSGDFSGVKLGRWATFDEVKSVAADMRQRAVITNKIKPASTGPFYVVELEVQKLLSANVGFASPQQDLVAHLRGGGTQAELLIPSNERQTDYLVHPE